MLQIALLLFGAEFIRGKHITSGDWAFGVYWYLYFYFIDSFFQYICLVFYCYLKV